MLDYREDKAQKRRRGEEPNTSFYLLLFVKNILGEVCLTFIFWKTTADHHFHRLEKELHQEKISNKDVNKIPHFL